VTLQEHRLLLPWFDEPTAVRLLAGPQPATAAASAAARKWQLAREKLRSRNIGAFSTATQTVPRQLAARAHDFLGSTQLTAQPDFRGAEVRLVELASLLTFQARISTEGGGARFLPGYDGSLESIFTICLPVTAAPDPVQVAMEGHRATISSDNPNLLFGGFQLNGAALVAGFGFRPPWLQVVEYRGRLFVRNGYHRAWSLLHAGARYAFAVTLKAGSLAELGAAEEGYVDEAHLLSNAPPMLYDFEDPDLYATHAEPAYRRVIRITAVESMEQSPR
jgi:hypothetical protein